MPPQYNLKFLIKLFLLILLQHAITTRGEFYSSVHEMTKLVEYESVFLQHMQKFITVNENKLEFLKARLADFERDRDEALSEGAAYFDSPVNKYLLTKRLTVDWERIENLMEHNSGKKSLNNIERFANRNVQPDDMELYGAITGLLRIQDIYLLKTKDIVAGILDGVKYDAKLDARHCYDIAKVAFKENRPRLAHSWLLETLDRLPGLNEKHEYAEVEQIIDEAEVLVWLADTKHKLGDLKGANQTYAQIVEMRPGNETFVKGYDMFLQLEGYREEFPTVDLSDEHEPLPVDPLKTSQPDRYKYTCNGVIKQTPSEERELRCGYLTETHPFLRLAPIKVEEMNHDPLLVVYYDVVSDKEIEVMKMLTNHKVERATVMGVNGSLVSPVRTSQFVFLPKTRHAVLATIDRRVEDMTNLNMIFSEDHQFANYGIGGHYAQHVDWFVPQVNRTGISMSEMGNRIGTVLFYLTDVEQGGGTAFPFVKRLLMPQKGAAAFWYNLHASGIGDERTLHGACPIIVGSKWVQNRWIRENIQSDRRPCEVFNDKVEGPF